MKADPRLGLLGLAHRAGCVINGEGQVLIVLQALTPVVVFLASDAGENIRKKLIDKTRRENATLVTDFDTDTLSAAIGKINRKALAIVDPGFVKALKKY
ncbi:MAG: hypothetical protein EA374_01140 [Acholeplasmatales bacterium]|nr:MAG: hypothetical protein EA374_01140 [Acholeplasmatales bacterium]